MSIVQSNNALFRGFTGCQYLQSCLILYASGTLIQYFAVTEGTQKEKYGINTLHDLCNLYLLLPD